MQKSLRLSSITARCLITVAPFMPLMWLRAAVLASSYPVMANRIFGRNSHLRVPLETSSDKVDELAIRSLEQILYIFGRWHPGLASAIGKRCRVVSVKEQVLPSRLFK